MAEYIEKQAAIEAIANCTNCGTPDELRKYVDKHSLENVWTGGVLDAMEAVEDIPAAIEQQRWFPITERMPEENDFVLVTVSGEDVRGCEWKDSMALAVWTNQWNLVDANLVSYRISAWRPLPEPYKEGKA